MLLIAIVLVSSILSIASGIGIDGWQPLSGSDPTLTAVDISAKGNQVWIIGSDGALHYWSVSALTPDGDWQWIDEDGGTRKTPYPLKHIGATLDGCVWTGDQKGNVALYNSSASNWTTITGLNVSWVSGLYCNSSIAVSTTPAPAGTGNTDYYYQNKAWTQLFQVYFGTSPSCATIITIGDNNQAWLTNSNSQIFGLSPFTTQGTWVLMPGSARQIDADSGNRVIMIDPNGNMNLWNGGGWTGIPGGPAVRATINDAQAFYIDASGNAYSTNITP